MEKKESKEEIPNIYADFKICCDECFYDNEDYIEWIAHENDRHTLFKKYLDKYVKEGTLKYKQIRTHLINYSCTKSVYVRKYSFELKENGVRYAILSNCKNECTCCYTPKHCSERTDDSYEQHVCKKTTMCECSVYCGSKWHVAIDNFKIYCYQKQCSTIIHKESVLNRKKYAEMSDVLENLSPLECIIAIFAYQPFNYAGNDK